MMGRLMTTHQSRAYGTLSGSAILDINERLAEIEAKYAGSAISDARRKPMPLSILGRVARIQQISSNETLQISVA